jgi:hypothetical protein
MDPADQMEALPDRPGAGRMRGLQQHAERVALVPA